MSDDELLAAAKKLAEVRLRFSAAGKELAAARSVCAEADKAFDECGKVYKATEDEYHAAEAEFRRFISGNF